MTPRLLRDLDEFWRVRSLVDFDAPDPEARDAGAARSSGGGSHGGAASTGRGSCATTRASWRSSRPRSPPPSPTTSCSPPSRPMTAFPAEWPMPWGDEDDGMAHIGFTAPYNMSGQPAARSTAGSPRDGRTIGLQVVRPPLRRRRGAPRRRLVRARTAPLGNARDGPSPRENEERLPPPPLVTSSAVREARPRGDRARTAECVARCVVDV